MIMVVIRNKLYLRIRVVALSTGKLYSYEWNEDKSKKEQNIFFFLHNKQNIYHQTTLKWLLTSDD